MSSLAPAAAAETLHPLPDLLPDYCPRALALWPRLERHRLARVRNDPHRVAALISRRTALSYATILELLGAPPAEPDTLSSDH